jgi:hypothetical protein
MNTKFVIKTIRGRRVAALTIQSYDDQIDTVMAPAVAPFRSECARQGVAVASASTIEAQLSLFDEHADVSVFAFATGTARKSAASARRRARRIA